jgi:hypothetical protein
MECRKSRSRQLIYPAGGSFYDLLHWHLFMHGTRPDGEPDQIGKKAWSKKDFAGAVNLDVRTVSYWLNKRRPSPPRDLTSIEEAMFGNNPGYAGWRANLRTAFNALGDERKEELPARPVWSKNPSDRLFMRPPFHAASWW